MIGRDVSAITAGGISAGDSLASHPLIEETNMSAQAFLYIVAVILIVLAALPLPTRGISLALLGAACALLAYAWPVITA
ncbi:hypothetical protein FHU34_112609 [Micromonospora taraxaci]|uniref:Uncharacterized protein n=1 Tax=Micromonospora taraxaci TaxID=1316803 RepID=A0A561W078_9ACTN|nr:hypothetical protein FHU34_112609 [Micromonospora taraxaci]